MENTVYDVVLNKITNNNLKATQKEKLIKLLKAIMANNGKLYINKNDVVIEYITLANRFNGGMNSTGFKKVIKQGEFSNSIREYTDFSFDTLLEYYDANNAVIEREIAKTENIPLKQEDIIGSFSKHISEMKDITREDKEIVLSTLLALKNSKNGRLYLIKPNENNNYSYEEFLIANEDEIALVKHIIGDGSNSIKNRERLTPSTLIARLTELEEQKNSDKKRVRNKF